VVAIHGIAETDVVTVVAMIGTVVAVIGMAEVVVVLTTVDSAGAVATTGTKPAVGRD
jgi:hypothetical protein